VLSDLTANFKTKPIHHQPPPSPPSTSTSASSNRIDSTVALSHTRTTELEHKHGMDTLVARYSRPTYQQNEVFSEQDQQDFTDVVPPLSLKFAMPPVAHVSQVLGFPVPLGLRFMVSF
jgi:hypothetical protein